MSGVRARRVRERTAGERRARGCRIGARIVAPSVLLAALAGGLVVGPGVGPALASGSQLAAAPGSGSVQPPGAPPSPTGGGTSQGSTYVSSIGEDSSGSGGGTPWTPPACWMQPFFPQVDTYKPGDPSGGITDADSYYSWFVSQGAPALASATQTAAEFTSIQDKKAPAGWTGPTDIEANDSWWAPNWLDSSAGFACAEALVAKNNLSNGYIGLEPPLAPGQQSTLTGAISPFVFAEIVRAQITLPTVSIVTSPSGTSAKTAAVVNTPTYVAVDYHGDMNPSKTKSHGFFGLAPIFASVQATVTSVTVSSSRSGLFSSTTGFGAPGQTCATVHGEATPACSVTFSAPSGGAGDNLSVSVTWKVTWSTSGGTGGTFPNTGAQPPVSKTVVVNEIQSQT
jgi:enoyl reductase